MATADTIPAWIAMFIGIYAFAAAMGETTAPSLRAAAPHWPPSLLHSLETRRLGGDGLAPRLPPSSRVVRRRRPLYFGHGPPRAPVVVAAAHVPGVHFWALLVCSAIPICAAMVSAP